MALACFLDLFMFSRVLTLWPMEAGERDRRKLVMVTVSMGYPSLGTSRVSMPPAAPTNSTSQPELRVWNIWARATAGLTWPAVPPQVKRTLIPFFSSS